MFAFGSKVRLIAVRPTPLLGVLVAAIAFVGCHTEPVRSGMDMTPTLPWNLRRIIVFAPAPNYPMAARVRRIHGSGLVLMNIDKTTGRVTSATMEETTGDPVLDKAAMDAFRKWRFKPGISKVHMPITFEFHH